MFTPDTYARMVELYNQAIWPLQIVGLLFAVVVIWLASRPTPQTRRLPPTLLALCWLWTGAVFHIQHYATINWVAWGFGGLFILQGILLLWPGKVQPGRQSGTTYSLGLFLILFALAALPWIKTLCGHSWEQAGYFGVAPDPTAIGTLGFLIMAGGKTRWRLAIIPVVWCGLSSVAAWTMGESDALAPALAALLAVVFIFIKNSHMTRYAGQSV